MNAEKSKNKFKRHICFVSLIIIVALLTYVQWLYLTSQKEIVLISEIQHKETLIPGWEPSRNLQIATYIRPNNDTTVSTGKNVCPSDSPPNVILIVSSSIQNFEMRLAIRNTWAKDAYHHYNVSVAFLVGISLKEDLNIAILNENYIYKDLIVEDVIESKYNATVKSGLMLKWMLRNCEGANFLMKTEDDVFINVANLDKFVNNPTRVRSYLLVGKLIPMEIVERDSMHEKYMPKYMYHYDTYPEYLSGVGYLMTKDTVLKLFLGALRSSMVYLEDVFITGICADIVSITRFYDFRFYYIEGENYRMDCEILYQQNLIVHSHNLNVVTMYENFEELQKCLELQRSGHFLEHTLFT